MSWDSLRADIVDEFVEAQRRPARALTRVESQEGEHLAPAVRRRVVRELTRLEVAFLVQLRKDPRVAGAGRALMLGSRDTRKMAERLVSKRCIRLEHLKNKRRTLVARFVSGGFYG